MAEVLIGRVSELARLDALDALEGPAALVVVGDPGSGKSRLLAEGAERSARHVVRVVGYEPERLVPLAAASELLRAVVADIAFGEAVEPLRVFETAHRALRELGPLLLVVDDVQWVDELSLALLHYVLRAAASADGDLHLLAAGRPASRTHALGDALVALLSPSRAGTLELAGLSREDGVRLARAIEPGLGEAAAAAIWNRSGGLPFWIDVLARGGGEPVEAGRLLTSRLRGAGADASALVSLLAVVARPVSGEGLCELLGWPTERVESASDQLLARGLASREHGSLRLAHDLIRAAAAAELPDGRRGELHSTVARWLESAARGDVATLREALEHRRAAGEPCLDVALALASSSQRRHLGRGGLLLLAAIADDAGRGGARLRKSVAELASDLGEHAVALERWSELAGSIDPDGRSAALLQASKAAFELGSAAPGRARELVNGATTGARSDDELVRLLAHEARILLWLEHRTEEGALLAREAVSRSEGLGAGEAARRARFESLRAAYEAAMQEDRGGEMLRLADCLLAESDDDAARAEALISRGLAQRFTRPIEEAVASLRAAVALAERGVLPAHAVDAGFWLAQSLHDKGDLDEAQQVGRETEQLAARVGDVSRVRAHVRRIMDRIALEAGRQEEGLAGLAAEAEAEPDPHYRLGSRQAAAQFLARAAGPAAGAEVAALLALAHADAAASGCPRCSSELRLAAVEALALIGRADDAAAELDGVAQARSSDPLPALWRLRAHAHLAAARGTGEAVALLEEACALAAELGRRLEELWLRAALGRALASVDRERAAAELRAAAARADEIGAVTLREVAEQELRRLGVRTWRRGRARVADGSLSERELQVAELVRRGASNPEIAQALFLSRKTVERHVSSVLAKAGVRNRAELAALLSREGEGSPR